MVVAAATHAQRPTFTTGIEAVRVDVLVTGNGRPMQGLRPADFEVLDSGVVQQVEILTVEELPLSLVLAFDLSDSVTGERLDHLRAAARVVLDRLGRGDRAALLTFSHLVTLRQGSTPDIGAVSRSLAGASPGGDTALVDGAFAGLMLAESDPGRTLVIVFSDGVDTSSWLPAPSVLDAAKRCHAVVYSVSAGASRPALFLRDLSAATGGTLFEVRSTRTLPAIFSDILAEFRQRYVLSYTPRGVPTNGWHPLDVRVKRRHAAVKARPGYFVGAGMAVPVR
jgi:VWFA-related protein